jgi:hypothetical protein
MSTFHLLALSLYNSKKEKSDNSKEEISDSLKKEKSDNSKEEISDNSKKELNNLKQHMHLIKYKSDELKK